MAEPGTCASCNEYRSLEKKCTNCHVELCNECSAAAEQLVGSCAFCGQRFGDVCINDIMKTGAMEPIGFHY